MSQQDTINWSRKSLAELQAIWNAHIEPDLARDGLALDRRPTYEELVDAGYSGIAYALREHHELTLGQFLTTVGYPESDSDGAYPWGIDDETTIHELELYLDTNLPRKGLAESTIDSKRSRLARYVRTYADRFGPADIVTRVREDAVTPRGEKQRVRAVFDTFDQELDSAESKHKHLTDVRLFYEWLAGDRDAEFNPSRGAPHETRWKGATPDEDDRDPPALEAAHVRSLVEACESPAERLLVVAACAWGLRRGEIAALSIDQFEPSSDGRIDVDADDPRIVFGDERKNGPGRVSVHYGLETLADRVLQLADREDWNGYLFPSSAASSGHVTPDTITARFKRLAERADICVRGETPTPQYGRRFWYRTYADAVETLAERVEAIADEQGSDDASVVVENYLGEGDARKRRRKLMHDRLAEPFEA
ncbi:tyrosine-type recombinase/integrase [Halosolutus amylolyticus]|uniref:Tyrosine-type recombinase/integrase n=1 Tax=Halosolutus amylolyticus TaxID=2932267 RepID=A0ABD5PN61_9EURY|nr:site-specific integrase [Halosolutus amylolyticus]